MSDTVTQIRRRIPEGAEAPLGFDDFLRSDLPFPVEWNGMVTYGLSSKAQKSVVPFLRLPDGGLVALWYHSEAPAVVHVGAHGERKLIANSFDGFVKSVDAGTTGLSDFDELEAQRSTALSGREPDPGELSELQEKFIEWCKMHSALEEPLSGADAEALRSRVHNIAVEMIRDGLSQTYKDPSAAWWAMSFVIERNNGTLSITYLDYGAWYPVPKKYGLTAPAAELLTMVKHKNHKRYELTCSVGIVSIDRDRELVLLPSTQTADEATI